MHSVRTATRWWDDRPVAIKLVLLVGLVATAAVLVALVGLSRLAASTRATRDISRDNVDQIIRIDDVADAANRAFIQSRNAALSSDTASMDTAYAALGGQLDRLRTANAAYGAHARDDEGRATARRIAELTASYTTFVATELEPLARADRDAEWYEVNRASTRGQQMYDLIAAARQREVDAARDAAERAARDYEAQRWTVITTLVISLSGALLLTAAAARRLAQRLAQVRTAAVAIGHADLTVQAGVTGKDEIGVTAAALDEAVALLASLVEARLSTAEHAATHDQLTGLVNRRGLVEPLEAAARDARQGAVSAVLFIDLDGFKAVNDAWGHEVGDALLITVAQRLTSRVGEAGVVARTGGDEFVVVMAGLADVAAAHERAALVRELDAEAFPAPDGSALAVGMSTGLAVADRARSTRSMLAAADAAMYADKVSRREGARADQEAAPAHRGSRRVEPEVAGTARPQGG